MILNICYDILFCDMTSLTLAERGFRNVALSTSTISLIVDLKIHPRETYNECLHRVLVALYPLSGGTSL